jgi:hypothetical protein
LVRVSGTVAVAPRGTLPKFTAEGLAPRVEEEGATGVPVPASATFAAIQLLVVLKVRDAENAPAELGEKDTLALALLPGASFSGNTSPVT